MRTICITILLLLCLHGYAQQRMYLVAGQSNAQGKGDASLSPLVDTLTAFEYNPGLNQLIHLQDPVGQNAAGFLAANDGSPWPAFGKKYFDLTADTLVLVQAARAGSGLHPLSSSPGISWSQSGILYTLCSFKMNQARSGTGMDFDGIVWLQGETDGKAVNDSLITQNDYRDELIVMIDNFRSTYGCHLPFYIVLVGTFTGEPPAGFDAIRAAQEEVAAMQPNTHIIHETTVDFPVLGWMSDNVHYNQTGYNNVGTVGATNLVDIENTYYSININGTDTICPGDSTELSAPDIYAAYNWSSGQTSADIFVGNAGTYNVTVTDDNGCSFPLREIVITAAPLQIAPVINMAGNNPLCIGDDMTLSVPPALAYLWSNGATSQSITISAAGNYSVQTLNSNGCLSESSDTISVLIDGETPPLVLATGSTNFCDGESVVLNAPVGFNAYQWSNGDTTQTTTITTAGTFTCVVTNANGCSSVPSASITTQVQAAPPAPSITSSGSTLICENDSLTLSAPPGYTAYLWSDGSTSQNITVSNTGTYTCAVTNANGCNSTNSDPITILAFPNPQMPFITANSATTFCAGDSVVLVAPMGYDTYQWSNGGTGPEITVYSSGFYTCIVTNSRGCVSEVSLPVEVNTYLTQATPGIAANGPTTFCEGESVVLSAPLGFVAYLWSNGETTQSITVEDSGQYSCQIINSFGCESPTSIPIAVTVNPTPATPNITSNNPLVFCEGDSTELNAPPGYADYNWSNGETTQNITVYDSGTFTCMITDFNGCSSPISTSLTTIMNLMPEAPSIGMNGPTTLCNGESVLLTMPVGFEEYLWSNGETTPNTLISTSGLYDCTLTDINGCTTTAFMPVSITVNPAPATPLIQTNGATTFCEGDSVVLNVTAGYNYQWSNGDTSQLITVYESGNYICTVTNGFGCSSVSNTLTTVMNPLPPQPMLTFSGSTEFCEGDSVIVFAPAGYNYQWSSGETTQNITIDETAGPIVCKITDTNGCAGPISEPVFVIENPLPSTPIIDTIGNTSFCVGQNVVLNAPVGFAAYYWNNGETTQSIEVSNSGIFAVSVVDANGCESDLSATMEISANPLPSAPVITTSSATSFCEGGNVILTAPGAYVSYQWSTGATTQSIMVEETGIFSCVVTDNNGCQSQPSNVINTYVNPNPPAPSIDIVGDTILCPGDSTILQGILGFAAYYWSNGGQTQNLIVNQSGEYSYYVIDEAGCQSPPSEPVFIEIRPAPPVPNIVSSDNLSFCEGDSITLFADPGYQSYLWSTGDTTESIVVNTADDFFYTATDGVSCTDPVSDIISTSVRLVPADPEVYLVGTDSLCSDVMGSNYLWLLNDTLVSGLNTPCIVPETSGYWRVIIVENGCPSEVSDTLYFEKPPPPPDPNDPKNLLIYPNPNNGFLTIETTNIFEETAILQLYDILGQVVYEELLDIQAEPQFMYTIDIRRLPDAAYFVVLRGGASGQYVQKLIVDR